MVMTLINKSKRSSSKFRIFNSNKHEHQYHHQHKTNAERQTKKTKQNTLFQSFHNQPHSAHKSDFNVNETKSFCLFLSMQTLSKHSKTERKYNNNNEKCKRISYRISFFPTEGIFITPIFHVIQSINKENS